MTDPTCDACGQRRSWGCGHTPAQEAAARRHYETKAHKTGKCWHYDHSACDPTKCKLAGTSVPGYAAFITHAEQAAKHGLA